MAKKSARIQFDQQAVESLGISGVEFQSRVQSLVSRFGKRYVRALAARAPVKPQHVRVICRDAAIMTHVSSLPGLPSVCKRMVDQTDGWVHDAVGEWFQLQVASLCEELELTPALEAKLVGVPKDVLIEHGAVQIECKAFLVPYAAKQAMREHAVWFDALEAAGLKGVFDVEILTESPVTSAEDIVAAVQRAVGASSPVETMAIRVTDRSDSSGHVVPSLPPEVTEARLQLEIRWDLPDDVFQPGSVIGNGPGLTTSFAGPPMHLLKKGQDAVESKLSQMVPDVANIIALDLTMWFGDLPRLADELQSWIADRDFRSISAVLLCRTEGAVLAPAVRTELRTNRLAAVPLSPDLVRSFGEHDARTAATDAGTPS